MMRVIDYRSDTKTLPTPEMRRAMAEAELGDDVAGEDPTVNRLEAMAAEMLGKEAAVLVSSGTQGNLVAILAQCQRGDEIIVGDGSHIFNAEGGGASVLGGVALHPLPNDHRGMIDPEAVEQAIRPADVHYSPTKMVALENTHNAAGGAALTPEDTARVADVAHANGIGLHIDGARIFNSAVYLETPVSELVKDAETVSFCLSKGLGAPVGSLLCGSNEVIQEARRWRQMLGSGMRQAGIIAACGIVALQNVDRLAEDHSNARKLANGLAEVPGITIEPERLPTNLLFCEVTNGRSSEMARRLGERGVKVGERVGTTWRLVTHHDISPDDIDYTLAAFQSVFSG
jgi:threonine aldolase